MAVRERGKIKFYKSDKGYGFIVPDDGGKDIFLHSSDLPNGLRDVPESQSLSYEVELTERGLRARKINML